MKRGTGTGAAGKDLDQEEETDVPRARRPGKESLGGGDGAAGGNFWGKTTAKRARDEGTSADPSEVAAVAVRELATRLLAYHSAPHPHGGSGHVLPGERMSAEISSLDVWDMVSARQVTVPTLSVLLTNVISGQAVPDTVDVNLRTDHKDLQLLSKITADEVRGTPLIGCDESGGTFQLLPEQLALALVLARGPLASRLAEEIGKKKRGAAASSAKGKGKASAAAAAAAAAQGPPMASWYSPPDDPAAFASFSMVVATMGAGKTSTVLSAALRVLFDGWAQCEANFPLWSQRTVNNDPSVLIAKPKNGDPTSVIPCHSTAVSRTVLIITTAATFEQWRVSAQQTLHAFRPGWAEFHSCDSNSKAARLFKLMAANPTVPRVAVLGPTGLNLYFRSHSRVGCAVLVVDEISTHARSLPTGQRFGAKPFPSAYRMIGLSATPGRLFELTENRPRYPRSIAAGFVKLGGGNLLKGLLLGDPMAKVLGQSNKRKCAAFVCTWRRFVLANVAPALQIALSERAASMMAQSVEVSAVHARPHTLADEATAAMEARRPGWPMAAARLHALFFRVAITGAVREAASHPCTLLRDVIRLELAGLRYKASLVAPGSPNDGSIDMKFGCVRASTSVRAILDVMRDPEVAALLSADGTGTGSAAAAAGEDGQPWARIAAFSGYMAAYPGYGAVHGGSAGLLNADNASVVPGLRSDNIFLRPDAEVAGRLALCRLVESGERPCAACERVCPVREMRYCARCCALLCAADSPTDGDPCCKVCHPRPGRVLTDLGQLRRATGIYLNEAIASAVASLAAAGHPRILFLSRFRSCGTEAHPRAHSFLAGAFAAAGEALGKPVRVLLLRGGGRRGEGIDTDAIACFRAAEQPTVLCLADTGASDEQITGLNLGCADAVVALGRLTDEQQAFSRALRMRPGAQRERLPVVRIMPHVAASCDAGAVRGAARFGRTQEPAGAGAKEKEKAGQSQGGAAAKAAAKGPDASAREAAAESGRRFIDGVLEGCRAEMGDNWLQAEDHEFVSPFGRTPEWVSLSFEPPPHAPGQQGAAAEPASFCGSGAPRISRYEIASARVTTVDGAAGSSVQFLFASPLRDPFVPSGALALRISFAETSVADAPAGLGLPVSAGGVQAVAEWIGEAQTPLRAHPDFPCNRLRVCVQLAPPLPPPVSAGGASGSGSNSAAAAAAAPAGASGGGGSSSHGAALDVVAAVVEEEGAPVAHEQTQWKKQQQQQQRTSAEDAWGGQFSSVSFENPEQHYPDCREGVAEQFLVVGSGGGEAAEAAANGGNAEDSDDADEDGAGPAAEEEEEEEEAEDSQAGSDDEEDEDDEEAAGSKKKQKRGGGK